MDFYSNPANRDPCFRLEYEGNREVKRLYFQDAMNLCANTKVCERFNISLFDIMKMDCASYILLKDKVEEIEKLEMKTAEKTARDTEKLTRRILNNNNNN